MLFIGQYKIIIELEKLLLSINNGNNYNILLRAPSGYGKTTLALILATKFGLDDCTYSIGEFSLDRKKRFHIIDEVHEIKEPEFLYSFMDSTEYTFVLLTNESGILKEPLMNRSIQFIFENYKEDELKRMIKHFLPSGVSDGVINNIYTRTKGNPRIAKMLCTRLSYMAIMFSEEEIDGILNNIINIDSNGLNYLDNKYLDFLEKVGGTASLDLIINGTKIDRATILREIEPGLLYLGKIRITRKGRELCS